MDEKRKYHFEWNETKIEILEFILKNSAHVKEQDISEFMKKKHEGFNRTTTNKHLHQLEKLGCIEKVSPVEKSRLNYWDIINFKNLQNIIIEFPEIQMNEYKKSSLIVFENAKSPIYSRTIHFETGVSNANVTYTPLQSGARDEMLRRFKYSPAFLKFYLDLKDNLEKRKNFDKFVEELIYEGDPSVKNVEGIFEAIELQSGSRPSISEWKIDTTFIACVYIDILEGQSSPEAIEYMRELKNVIKDQFGSTSSH